ncbi:MAG: hypothetical protein HKN47_07050 [Pirellulaceae bacterium]|nr:hypothetical protein [Pirellulaceae bacterium]
MKRTTIALALLLAALFTVDASAQRPDKPGGKRGEAGQRAKAGQDGAKQNGAKLGARGAAERDPAQLVARMMQEFDKDGDQKLDVQELTALLKSMRERRGQAGGRPGGRPDGAQAGARRRPGGGPDGQGKPGGDQPKRPSAE